MYPQYSPVGNYDQPPVYQTVPQFNPMIRLSPQIVPVIGPEPEPEPEPLSIRSSPPSTFYPPRVSIEYREVEPVITISPPRVPRVPRVPIGYDDYKPITRLSPPREVEPIRSPVIRLGLPRVIEPIRPPVVRVSPPKLIEPIRLPSVYQKSEPFNQLGGTTLTDLPDDILIELLINLPPERLSVLCRTSSTLSRFCNNENLLGDLIVRKYHVNVARIPGQTIKEKYIFISQFDPRYFTDPNFVIIPRIYELNYGLNYTSRRNPNDALNTIVSILNDSQTADDINILKSYPVLKDPDGEKYIQSGFFSPRLVSLLSGAIMTQSQSFAKQIILILAARISAQDRDMYTISMRGPVALALLYKINDTYYLIDFLMQSFDKKHNQDPESLFEHIATISRSWDVLSLDQ